MVKDFLKVARNTKKQIRWWAYAAWTLPFTALAILSFEQLIGWESIYGQSITIISVIFFTISVYWWWWAIHRFYDLLVALNATAEKLQEVKEELKNTKEFFNEKNPSNW